MLPVYSSTLDLGLAVEHLAIAPTSELSHESSNSPVMPSYDPPLHSYISSLGNTSAAPIGVTPSQKDPTPGSGGSSAIPPPRRQQHLNLVQHRLYLKKNGAAKPWATLRLISRAPLPSSKRKVPTFTGGDLVEGALELDLDNPMSVRNITIKVSLAGKVAILLSGSHHGWSSLGKREADNKLLEAVCHRSPRLYHPMSYA